MSNSNSKMSNSDWIISHIDFIDDRVFFVKMPSQEFEIRKLVETHPELDFSLEELPRKFQDLVRIAANKFRRIEHLFDAEERKANIITNLVREYNQWALWYDNAARREGLAREIQEEIL